MTNADKIRALPDEIMAQILWSVCNCGIDCLSCPVAAHCGGTFRLMGDWEAWLESEAEGAGAD